MTELQKEDQGTARLSSLKNYPLAPIVPCA